jgi:hypothetical protein
VGTPLRAGVSDLCDFIGVELLPTVYHIRIVRGEDASHYMALLGCQDLQAAEELRRQRNGLPFSSFGGGSSGALSATAAASSSSSSAAADDDEDEDEDEDEGAAAAEAPPICTVLYVAQLIWEEEEEEEEKGGEEETVVGGGAAQYVCAPVPVRAGSPSGAAAGAAAGAVGAGRQLAMPSPPPLGHVEVPRCTVRAQLAMVAPPN